MQKRDVKQRKRGFKPIGRLQEQRTHMHLLSFEMTLPNIHRFSDINDLFGPIVIFPDRSIELVAAVQFPSSHRKL